MEPVSMNVTSKENATAVGVIHGGLTKKIDFHTNYGLIVEVNEHYGD